MRAVGVDVGSRTWCACSVEVSSDALEYVELEPSPQELAEWIASRKPELTVIAGGYGLPWKPASRLKPEDIEALVLLRKDDPARATGLLGLRRLLQELLARGVDPLIMPSVKLLPTVPLHRKLQRVDLGTPDKLAEAFLAVKLLSEKLNIGYEEVNACVVDLGSSYTAIIAVDRGLIVDGIGGTLGPPAPGSPGAIDAELAYLVHVKNKKELAKLSPYALSKRLAEEQELEEIEKRLAGEALIISEPRYLVVWGSRAELFKDKLRAPTYQVVELKTPCKPPALGAALIARGILGGPEKSLVAHMKLLEARGSPLDYTALSST